MNPNAPSAVGSLLMGTWVSATAEGGAGFPDASDCTELAWTITEETGSNYAGEFTATCNDGIQLAGTATGVLTGNTLDIDASGTATLPDVASCAFTLTGTAVLQEDTIQVDYAGNTCLGSVSGSELLQRS